MAYACIYTNVLLYVRISTLSLYIDAESKKKEEEKNNRISPWIHMHATQTHIIFINRELSESLLLLFFCSCFYNATSRQFEPVYVHTLIHLKSFVYTSYIGFKLNVCYFLSQTRCDSIIYLCKNDLLPYKEIQLNWNVLLTHLSDHFSIETIQFFCSTVSMLFSFIYYWVFSLWSFILYPFS